MRKARSAVRRVTGLVGILPSVMATFVFRTHTNRWHQVAHAGRPPWDERNQVIGNLIEAGSTVLDIGSGAQTLRGYLPQNCTYQPCDVIKSTPDVIFCDFNAGTYPEPGKYFDYVVCSGVFEYIRKPAEFLNRVPRLGRTVLFSYNPYLPGSSKIQRLGNNWVNHFTQEELQVLFQQAGLVWEILQTKNNKFLIYSLNVAETKKP